MLRSASLALVAIFCFAAVAHAADIDGRWTGSVTMPNGNEFTLVYDFQSDGETLTGSLSTPNGSIPISNGKVQGDALSFTMTFGEMTIEYQGKVSGDELELTSQGPQGERVLTLTRDTET